MREPAHALHPIPRRPRFASALRRRLGRQDGVVLVIVAMSMVFILGAAALAIDLGSLYTAQRHAQAAADAAALAAAQDLPADASQASTDATSYATTNYPGATVSVTTPYNSASGEVKVSVSQSSPVFFARIFGVTSEKVNATAVAGSVAGVTHEAIFAANTTCSPASGVGVVFDGSGNSVTGGIVSDGNLYVDGSSMSFGPVTYGGPNSCAYTAYGNGFTYASGPTPVSTDYPWPTDYTSFGSNPANCTFYSSSTGTPFTWNTAGSIPSGVYCAPNGTIAINGSGITGTGVTLIAKSFQINGSSITLTPNASANGLVLYQTGTSTLQINGSGILNGGTVFAPNATVQIDGSGTATGFIEAQNVYNYGTSLSFTGNGPSMGVSSIEMMG